MMNLINPNTNFDFARQKNFWMGFSVVFMVFTVVLFFTKGFNYGIDFTGGSEILVKAPVEWDIARLRKELDAGGIEDARVQQIGADDEHAFMIKVQGDEQSLNKTAGLVENVFKEKASGSHYSIDRIDVVGPAAGASLRTSAFLSLLYAMISIMIYVIARFDARYAPGAIVSIIHDITIVMGIFILTQKQFNLQIVAAVLALIGYSINDTIVVFDRVREVTRDFPKLSIYDAVNKAVNETLGRTLTTGISVFVTVFCLWMWGGKIIEDFAFTLMIGLVVGTYSSIFIASGLVIVATEFQERKKRNPYAKKKKEYKVRPEPKHLSE